MFTVAIIQARMSSNRLPGKVLADIAGKPMLFWVVERTRQAGTIDAVAVATTRDGTDNAIEETCRANDWPCFRGDAFDVLDRYYQAARYLNAESIVRLTADCPLIDPRVIDRTVDEFRRSGADFAANRLPPPWKRTYPIGLDTEVCSFSALERAWKEAHQPYQREHVMPYLYDQEGRFKVWVVDHEPDYGSYRWTVDTPEDLSFIRRVFSLLEDPLHTSWLDVLRLVQNHPELTAINASVPHKSGFDVDERVK